MQSIFEGDTNFGIRYKSEWDSDTLTADWV